MSLQTTGTGTGTELFPGLATVLQKATPAQTQTAERLLSFASSGELSEINDVSRGDVQSLANLLVTELGAANVANLLESRLGMPASQFLALPDPAAGVADLFEAVTTNAALEEARPLIFTDNVQPDGTVSGHVHVIPAGTKRVYAAFESKGALQNLDHVLAVWRDPSNEKMVFTEFESVRSGSSYNYVWLELKEGWPPGFYRLDLFHPQRNKELLASRSFNVR